MQGVYYVLSYTLVLLVVDILSVLFFYCYHSLSLIFIKAPPPLLVHIIWVLQIPLVSPKTGFQFRADHSDNYITEAILVASGAACDPRRVNPTAILLGINKAGSLLCLAPFP